MKKYGYRMIALALIPVLLSACAASLAWFTLSNIKTADIAGQNVEKPPTISVINNETTTEDILHLEGMQIGSPKFIVFCVTPMSDLVTKFSLQLSYTTNLNATIDLYPCEYVGTSNAGLAGQNAETVTDPQTGDYVVCPAKDGSATDYYYRLTADSAFTPVTTSTGNGYSTAEATVVNNENPANLAVYKMYKDVTAGQSDFFFTDTPDHPWSDSWANNRNRFIFYALYIHWDGGLSALTDKEVDVVYISAKGIVNLI